MGRIYGDAALKLFELGLTPIPTNGKIPLIKNWEKYSIIPATSEEVESWVDEHATKNIGIVLGPASGLVAIDVDIDNDEILALVPKTPIVRIGKKGGVFFYKHHPSVSTRRKRKDFPPIEILSKGTQVIIPNSIHPDTKKPYIWEGDLSLFDVDFRDHLPTLKHNDIVVLLEKASFIYKNLSPEAFRANEKDGRNNTLKAMVLKKLSDFENKDKVIFDILKYDKENHVPPLFEDKKENVNPVTFVENIIKSMNNAGVILNASDVKVTYTQTEYQNTSTNPPSNSGVNDSVVEDLSEELQIDDEIDPVELKSQVQIAPTFDCLLDNSKDSILPKIFLEINKRSDQDISGISLCGALSIVAACISQTWAINVDGRITYPNMMSLMIAPSGLGKKAPYSFLKGDICKLSRRATAIVGRTGYGSSSGVFTKLKEQPVRLDLIEEMSEVFRRMGDKKSVSNASIMETLCTMWDSAESFFSPPESKASNKDGTGGVFYNPHVNIISATTPANFKESVQRFMVTSGALPRFLFFCDELQDIAREWTAMQPDHDTLKKIANWIDGALQVRRFTQCEVDGIIDADKDAGAIIPRILTISDKNRETLRKVYLQFRAERTSIGSGHIMEAFLARKWQHFVKLCLVYECSRMPFHDSNFTRMLNQPENLLKPMWELSRESIDFAYRLIEKNIECAQYFLREVDNRHELDDTHVNLCNKIESAILESGVNGLSKTGTRRLVGGRVKSRAFDEAIHTLLDDGSLFAHKIRVPNQKPKTNYVHIRYAPQYKKTVTKKEF